MLLLSNALSILLLVIGFGFVIFWHELGHFLAAKWVGIKVEQFAVGMGHALVSFRKGIGVKVGNTKAEYDRRVNEYLEAQEAREPAAEKIEYTEKLERGAPGQPPVVHPTDSPRPPPPRPGTPDGRPPPGPGVPPPPAPPGPPASPGTPEIKPPPRPAPPPPPDDNIDPTLKPFDSSRMGSGSGTP